MGGFILCLNTSTIQPADLMTKISVTAEAGFQGIELWADDVDAFVADGGSLDEIKAALADRGLSVPSFIAVHDWGNTQGQAFTAAWDEARRRIALAAELGAPVIVATPPDGQVDVDLLVERYARLVALGREHGVRIAFEFLGFLAHINNLPLAWEIVQRAGDPDGCLTVDSFHIYRSGRSLNDLRAVPPERIGIVHVNDVPGDVPVSELTDADRVMPGDGVGVGREMLAILAEKGYRGAVSLELFNRSYWERPPAEVARIAFEKLQGILPAEA
ncbi:MAG TPA: sugar phosphate isomerase/epimerase [Caldilineae bacterium]|nr:sugar phosphate isomerase/epimerase [Caldilineae bacterium]